MTTGPFTLLLDQAVAAIRQSAAGCRRRVVSGLRPDHLAGDMAAVADNLRTDLDQLLLQAGQRPVFDTPQINIACSRQTPHPDRDIVP